MSHVFGWVAGALVVAAGGAASVWWLTQSHAGPEAEKPVLPVMDDSPDGQNPPKKTDFATGDDPKDKVVEVKFDQERALKYLKQLCDIGPRISATEGMKKQQEIIEKHFKDLGATVTRQEFKAQAEEPQGSRRDGEHHHLVAPGEGTRRILISTHYDTRPIADQEANRNNWNKPFVSANDGTSGVAFLMELGNHMKEFKSDFGVDFVLFDGEEYVFETTRSAAATSTSSAPSTSPRST